MNTHLYLDVVCGCWRKYMSARVTYVYVCTHTFTIRCMCHACAHASAYISMVCHICLSLYGCECVIESQLWHRPGFSSHIRGGGEPLLLPCTFGLPRACPGALGKGVRERVLPSALRPLVSLSLSCALPSLGLPSQTCSVCFLFMCPLLPRAHLPTLVVPCQVPIPT